MLHDGKPKLRQIGLPIKHLRQGKGKFHRLVGTATDPLGVVKRGPYILNKLVRASKDQSVRRQAAKDIIRIFDTGDKGNCRCPTMGTIV